MSLKKKVILLHLMLVLKTCNRLLLMLIFHYVYYALLAYDVVSWMERFSFFLAIKLLKNKKKTKNECLKGTKGHVFIYIHTSAQ